MSTFNPSSIYFTDMTLERPTTNGNRVANALKKLNQCYKQGRMPLSAGASDAQSPASLTQDNVTMLSRVGRMCTEVKPVLIALLENHLEDTIRRIHGTGDPRLTNVGRKHMQRAKMYSLVWLWDESLGGETELTAQDIMNLDAIKTINRRLGLKRMARDAHEFVQQDAVLWFTYLHHLACLFAFSQGKGMIGPVHVQKAAEVLQANFK